MPKEEKPKEEEIISKEEKPKEEEEKPKEEKPEEEEKKPKEELNMSIEDLVKDNKNEALINLIVKDFENLAREAEFNGLERLKYIIIDFDEFTNNNNCLTPTMKIIRKNVENKFKEKIDKLYDEIEKNKGYK